MSGDRYQKARETRANPFRRKRRPNQQTRYLNERESKAHPSLYDKGGNRK